MNTRASDLVAELRAILATLPGATSIGLHASETWTLVLITTSSDEVATALSEELGLGATEIARGVGRWWRRATSEGDQGALRIVVTGPHHLGLLPRDR